MIGKDRGNCQAKLVPQTIAMKEATSEIQQKYFKEFWARRRKHTAQPRRNTNQTPIVSAISRRGKE